MLALPRMRRACAVRVALLSGSLCGPGGVITSAPVIITASIAHCVCRAAGRGAVRGFMRPIARIRLTRSVWRALRRWPGRSTGPVAVNGCALMVITLATRAASRVLRQRASRGFVPLRALGPLTRCAWRAMRLAGIKRASCGRRPGCVRQNAWMGTIAPAPNAFDVRRVSAPLGPISSGATPRPTHAAQAVPRLWVILSGVLVAPSRVPLAGATARRNAASAPLLRAGPGSTRRCAPGRPIQRVCRVWVEAGRWARSCGLLAVGLAARLASIAASPPVCAAPLLCVLLVRSCRHVRLRAMQCAWDAATSSQQGALFGEGGVVPVVLAVQVAPIVAETTA